MPQIERMRQMPEIPKHFRPVRVSKPIRTKNEAKEPDPYYNIRMGSASFEGLPSHVNPYVVMWINFRWKHKEFQGSKVVWPTKRKTVQARWETSRALYKVPKDSGFLVIDVFNQAGEARNEKNDELIGSCEKSLEELKMNTRTRTTLEMRGYSKNPRLKGFITLERVRIAPTLKRVYFIRHGQSEWNRAKEGKHYVQMLKQIDHPLTGKGRKQAETLAMEVEQAKMEMERLRDEKESKNPTSDVAVRKLHLEGFLNANAIYCSPLTRAVQTACIGLAGHPMITKGNVKIQLYSDFREKRNFGSRDTTSKSSGRFIIARTRRKLIKLYPEIHPSNERFNRLVKRVDQGDSTDIWWNTEAETKKQIETRIKRALLHLRYAPNENIIVVGHSHFLRLLVGGNMSASFRERNPELAKELVSSKLDHCVVASTVIDFGIDESTAPKVEDFRFLFKSGRLLQDKKKGSVQLSKCDVMQKVTWEEFHAEMLKLCEDDVELAYGKQVSDTVKIENKTRRLMETGFI